MLGKLTVKPLLWACGLLLLAVAGLTGALVVQGARHDAAIAKVEADRDDLQTKLGAAEGSLTAAVEANAKSHKAVEDLAGKLDVAIRETERLDELLLSAETELSYTRRARDDALAKLESQRENVYASDPSCSAWGAAPVCGRITGSVLDEWRDAARRR